MLEFFIIIFFLFLFISKKYASPSENITSSENEKISEYNENRYVKRVKNERVEIALKKVTPYLYRYNNVYALKNQKVSFSYNYYSLVFYCLNFINKSKKFKIDFGYDVDFSSQTFSELEETYNEIFCKICDIFNSDTTYEDIYSVLQEEYTISKPQDTEYNEYPDVNQYSFYNDEKQEEDTGYAGYTEETITEENDNYDKYDEYGNRKTDINTATEEEISKLPGINIVMAKKIIVTRGDIGGFSSKEEFYSRFDIKLHFRQQLDEMIYFSKRTIKNVPLKDSDERMIDF